ncbi:membrane fusion protein, macrolide-specific efflux system [Collimonas sp. OK242]|jgi:macrolide-specific efflux system membrane fusion protein|uniref:efflux RND transporter periplasmic adaptor subunit n=1 Tax=Collimonas sp. OK242 TaxID=1798195 RepID=UPI00089458BD|nr:efflux RND transporter periplasmic adaptor subunit [Collimonas sp. OK242]SDX34734.1 membrane fusion protein, macrolide-specific efflux system [Collimonas sp. OK242]
MTVEPTDKSALPAAFSHTGRRWLTAILALLIALGAGFLVWKAFWHKPPPAPKPIPLALQTEVVRRGDIEQAVLANGKLQLHKYSDVVAQVSGQIKDVLVMVGDEVKSGKMVVEITPTLPSARLESNRAQLARLQAELADQRAQLDFAELQFKRQTQLKAENATREESYESSRMSMYSASARVEAINAQIRQIEATLKDDELTRSHTQVLAPIGGTVVSVAARTGQMINPGQTTVPLLRIADLSRLTVQARVAEIDVPLLRKGMTAYFTTPGYPGKRWSGKLRQVIPVPADGSGEQGKQTFYNVLFEVDNPQEELMSGMSTQVRFVLAQVHDAVILPVKLLGKPEADGSYVVRVADADPKANRQANPRKIKIGIRNDQIAQVLSGLEPGEQVVVNAVPTVAAATPAPTSVPAVMNATPSPAASAPKAR